MEKTIIFIHVILFIALIIPTVTQYDYLYSPEDIISYINSETMAKDDFTSIIDNILGTFKDAYTFYDIASNPPQTVFDSNYHDRVNIEQNLLEMKQKVYNEEITEVYDFYRQLIIIISKLKDSHIIINWKSFNFQDFYIMAPVEFYIKQTVGGEYKIFAKCLTNEFDGEPSVSDVLTTCEDNKENPIISINHKDPFEFINTFGGNFLSTKNEHATFSFKLKNHNQVSLSDFPLSLEELSTLTIQFQTESIINTQYYIGTDEEIDTRSERRRRRNLKNDNNIDNLKNNRNRNKKRKRKLNNNILWNFEEEDNFKCYEDTEKEINVYYISSFFPDNKDNYINTINNCYELFDRNTYPIVVINDLNDGGMVSLSQLFLGIISPLMSIDLYKGRIRITDTFQNTEDINYYIHSNLTNIENCLNADYNDLINKKEVINYGGDAVNTLTDLFFINNKNLHDTIENARQNIHNKRKPTEILIYTDGYSFSAAGLFMQYLQKSGGAIIAGYLGNPKYNNKKFDISQSPSPVFDSGLLKIFSPVNYNNLLNSLSNNNWEIQIPGIQSFYDSQNANVPLEYEVIEPDIHSNIYQSFELDQETLEIFISNAKNILTKFQTDCNKNNKNLVKISEECDGQFGNDYTHGGYECGNDGKWSNNCVPSYCDPGYFFNHNTKKCVKDICSSIEVIVEEDTTNPDNSTNKRRKKKNSANKISINMIYYVLFLLLFLK